jgi:hypothetical protein
MQQLDSCFRNPQSPQSIGEVDFCEPRLLLVRCCCMLPAGSAPPLVPVRIVLDAMPNPPEQAVLSLHIAGKMLRPRAELMNSFALV